MSRGRDAAQGMLTMVDSLLDALGVNDGRMALPVPSIDDPESIRAYAVEMKRRLDDGPVDDGGIEYEDVSDCVLPWECERGRN